MKNSIPALFDHIKSLPSDEARSSFAAQCSVTLGHLRNVAYGTRVANAELCTAVELVSKGALRRWQMRPADWFRIWPELIDAPGAPKLPRSVKRTTVVTAEAA